MIIRQVAGKIQDLYGGLSMVRFNTKITCHSKHGKYLDVTVFTSKGCAYYTTDGNAKAASRYLSEMRIWKNFNIKEGKCTWGKTKSIFSGGKFTRILNVTENVFCSGDTKFSYSACQLWGMWQRL